MAGEGIGCCVWSLGIRVGPGVIDEATDCDGPGVVIGDIPALEILRGSAVRLRRGPWTDFGVFGSPFRGFFAAGLENGRSRFGGRTWLRVCGSWYAVGPVLSTSGCMCWVGIVLWLVRSAVLDVGRENMLWLARSLGPGPIELACTCVLE